VNFLDRFIIAPLSPKWAARRAQWRKTLAYYEAAQPSRTRKSRTETKSANAENERSAVSLRVQARHLEKNLDIASGALDVLVNNIVGAGIQPEPQVELRDGELADEFNRALLRLWDDWIYSPEVTRQHDYYTLQQLACRSWLRDGEMFAQHVIGVLPSLDHRTVVPYSLECLEADFVPMDLTRDKIVQGIELNAWGAPLAYHAFKTHPGESNAWIADTKRVPAERMVHLKFVKRLHQLRGISVFAPVLVRMDDIKEIDESERVAARVAAAMAAFIKKGTPDIYEPPEVSSDGTVQNRQLEFVPGMVFDDLQPGEDVGTINPNRPNNALIPFRDSQLRSAAAGLGTSYSSLSRNYNGTYSAQRQELVEQYVNYRRLSGNFVFRWCQPVWDNFIDAMRASGALAIPREINLTTIYNATHTVPPMPWIDPVKEVTAAQLAEERMYTSRTRIIRQRGDNPDQVNREIQRDRAEREKRGLMPTVEPAAAPVESDDESKDEE
jgi:lambda family phage portal protein